MTVFLCTFALFLSGYVLQQQTVRSLQSMIIQPDMIPQSQYLDISSSHLAAHESDPHIDISSFSTQERLDFEKAKAVVPEPRRLRRGKVYNPRPADGYGPNGGKIGGYRSETTPERFRKGRAEPALMNETDSYEDINRGDVEKGDLLISINEGGASAAPWAGGKGWGDLDPTVAAKEKA